jgi:inhibitor of KinA sporulation pathway (predicted exonuclease)
VPEKSMTICWGELKKQSFAKSCFTSDKTEKQINGLHFRFAEQQRACFLIAGLPR